MQVLYHADCVDGFTAAYIFWLKNPGATFTPVKYGENPPEVTSTDLYLVDFCYDVDTLKRLALNTKITILDHHKTSFEALTEPIDNVTTVFDMERSGAGIAWDYVFGGKRPFMVDCVEDTDLWRRSIKGSVPVGAFLRAHKFTFEEWDKACRELSENPERIIDLGQAIIDRQDRLIEECMEDAHPMTIGGFDVPAAAAPYSLGSELANRLCDGYPFAAYYVDKKDGRHFGLRSRGEIDVEIIAKQYGGGGHPCASGFIVSRDHPLAAM